MDGKRDYNRIPKDKRDALLNKIFFEGKKIKEAAADLDINYSSAKTILYAYRKKKIRKAKTFKRCSIEALTPGHCQPTLKLVTSFGGEPIHHKIIPNGGFGREFQANLGIFLPSKNTYPPMAFLPMPAYSSVASLPGTLPNLSNVGLGTTGASCNPVLGTTPLLGIGVNPNQAVQMSQNPQSAAIANLLALQTHVSQRGKSPAAFKLPTVFGQAQAIGPSIPFDLRSEMVDPSAKLQALQNFQGISRNSNFTNAEQ